MTETSQPSDRAGRLAGSRLTIVGLGLMGGSLALALRGRCAEIVGVDHAPAAVELARARGVVDFATPDLESGLRHPHLIVLAAPVRSILNLLAQLPKLLPPRAERPAPPVAVLDLGSTKSEILKAMEALPEAFDPIGGHPMCGRETAGLVHADAALFKDQTFVLTPLARTTQATRQLALEIVHAIGARPLEISAARHDALTAVTSHLPYAAAAALVRAAQAADDDGAWQLAASGFRDTTRLAASDLTMMVDILLTNREAILRALEAYRRELEGLAELIEAGDPEALRKALAPAQARRREMFK